MKIWRRKRKLVMITGLKYSNDHPSILKSQIFNNNFSSGV